ncbi:MAG: hypothetical protein DRP35_10715 [Candidatus Zixiibacteriota bacterium]|nr:MAG: hypothetical protein DRP35_10715 [candidate division Zixibacteria bacterium]
MRKLYLIFAILFIAIISNAQVLRDYNYVPQKNIIKKHTTKSDIVVKSTNAYQLDEDFNASSNLPTGWSLQSPDGGDGWKVLAVGTSPVPGWQGGTCTDHTGATTGNVAFCTWSTGGSSSNDQYLITPQVAITNGDHINFWLQRSPDAYADNVDILLSTTGNNVSDFTVTLANLTFAANDGLDAWTEYNYDLSTYAGQSVYIAFREHVADNYNDGSAVFVDDVAIGQPEPWDAKLAALTIDKYVTLGNIDITGTIKNNGANTITAVDLKWSDGTNTYTDNLTGLNIASNTTYNFTHTTQLNVATATQYDIDVWVELASDADNSNDTVQGLTMHTDPAVVPYTVHFDVVAGDFIGWFNEDVNDDGSIWGIYQQAGLGHNDDVCPVYQYSSTNAADDYMYSNCIDLLASKTYSLDFWYKTAGGTTYPEKMKVMIGSSPASASMTNQIVDLGTITDTAWTQSSTTFTVPADGTYNLGFYAYSDADMWNLFFDDVVVDEVTNINEVSAQTISVYPTLTTGIVHFSVAANVEVYSQLGQLVQSSKNVQTIDLSSMSSGVYFVKVSNGNSSVMKKVVLTK